MLINKIVLKAGQIADRKELNLEDMNPDLLHQAREALSTLRTGTSSVCVSLPAGFEIAVSLGSSQRGRFEEQVQVERQKRYPDTYPAEYATFRKQSEERRRRSHFHLIYRGVEVSYHLVLAEGYSGIFGAVSGSAFHRKITPFAKWSEQEKEDHQTFCRNVAHEIMNLTPAFLVREMSTDPRLVFGDHFAVAMLLADASTQETKEI